MAPRLHHVFVATAPGAPEADALVELGMIEGSSNTHPGQGTANRRFFFEDMGLELIFLVDEREARSGAGRDLRLAERCVDETASPFGLVLRADRQADATALPGWRYFPDYFEPDMFFVVGDNSDNLAEPGCFLMPPNLPSRPPQALSPAPFRRVANVTLSLPSASWSRTLDVVSGIDRVTVCEGHDHHMEIEFGSNAGEVRDLGPDLPLTIRW